MTFTNFLIPFLVKFLSAEFEIIIFLISCEHENDEFSSKDSEVFL